MVFFSLPIFLLILTVPTSHRMYLCPRQHQPHQKSQGQGLRLSFTFGFPVSTYFVTSCCRIQNSTSGYIRNDPECNLKLDPQVAANPCATNSLSEFSHSVCPPCNFTEKKKHPVSNITHCLLCCLVCSHGIIYLSTSNRFIIINFLSLWLQKGFGRKVLKMTRWCKRYQG